jgi:hypothetical protein
MITDALLALVPIGSNLSLVGGAGVSFRSNAYDFLGLGVGVAPTERIIGNTTLFGQADAMGVGNQRPELNVTIGTSLVASVAGTLLNVALQIAPDTGVAGGYQPGTWQTIGETGGLTAAQCPANTVVARLPWLPPFPANLRPRFLSLLFSPLPAVAAPQTPGAFSAGTIASALVVMSRDDWFAKYAAKNYSVA